MSVTIAEELVGTPLILWLSTSSDRLHNIDVLAGFLQDLDLLHRACFYLGQGMLPSPAVSRAPGHLVLLQAHVGSLELQLVEEVARFAGPSSAIWLVARAIRNGPGQLSQWAALIPTAKEARTRARARTTNQQVKLLRNQEELIKAEMAVARLQAERGLTSRIADEFGTTVEEPPEIEARFGP